MPIGDSTPTSKWPRTGRIVRTCRGTVLRYVENMVPLALKRSVAARRFLNKICCNEGYLSGPKVCRSNLETPYIYIYIYIYVCVCVCVCVCKVFSPEAGPSLDMHYQGSTYLSLLDERKEKGNMSSPFLSLSQWLYGNTIHCSHRHKSAANTTTKHPHTPNSSQAVTAINGTEPSWELQILL